MNHILEQLQQSTQKKIIIIGDVMLDEYIFGSVARISPEAPVPIVEEHRKEWSLGGAANVALNCKHIGCDVTLIGVTGKNDLSGIRLRSMLEENAISLQGIVESNSRSTTCKVRIMAQNHQLIRIDKEDKKSLDSTERAPLLEQFKKALSPQCVIVVSDYAKGVIDTELMNEIITHARAHNSLVLVDPKGPCFLKYKGADYIKPNLKEFKEMVAYFGLDPAHSFKENAQKICAQLSLQGLIVTMGEQGIRFISSTSYIELPAIRREVFDLTGAGDTVIAFLSLGILNKLPMDTCLHLANRAASVAISHLKTYAVSLQEIVTSPRHMQKFFSTWSDFKQYCIATHIRRPSLIVHGVFSTINAALLMMIQHSKTENDMVIVVVEKAQHNAPPLEERAHVLSTLSCVDFVIAGTLECVDHLQQHLESHTILREHESSLYEGSVSTPNTVQQKYIINSVSTV